LINTYNIKNKQIIELGCGNGDFLALISKMGNNHGTGFDPSYSPLKQTDDNLTNIEIIADVYSAKHFKNDVDMIVCRQVLEHIENPEAFVALIRKAAASRPDCLVYIEVPNSLYTINDMGIWDFIYEHPSYYCVDSMSYLLEKNGFKVINCQYTYNNQYLTIEARPTETVSDKHVKPTSENSPKSNINNFADEFIQKINYWKKKLKLFKEANKRVVVWSAGSKGITFLNVLKNDANIEYVIDINPNKTGQFVSATGQEVVPPEFLKSYQPDVILIMNDIYSDEIKNQVYELGVKCEFFAV
jgi:SAM-dependent methyltransferase